MMGECNSVCEISVGLLNIILSMFGGRLVFFSVLVIVSVVVGVFLVGLMIIE